MELISLQALQRVKPAPPLPCPVRARVLPSVALAVAQGKTNFFVHQRASNTSSYMAIPPTQPNTRVVWQERRVSEYQKAGVMSSVTKNHSSDDIMNSNEFCLDAEF
tara:strand:+ start:1072 stop:1389 length:318 start_codon:yes stop_codon:yes gene_type:complete